MTTNGQAPFLTLFMYLSEAENEQEKKDLAMLIEETLHQSILGVKNKEGAYITPAFPKIIFVTEECNIHPDSEYYYLLELAAKCSNKRLTPDYISEKIMKELKEGNCYPVMGCVDGSENVTYKYNDELYLECFSEMWTRISNDISPENQHPSNPVGLFINTESNNLKIYDSAEGFVQVKKIIRNTTRKWYHFELEDGKTLTCTPDHPLPVYQKGRCKAQTLEVGDKLYVDNSEYLYGDIDKAAHVFSLSAIKSIRVEQLDHEEYSYDVETESDHFEVSGIYSYNCRSALNVYKNENGEYQFYGRLTKAC